jgi:hypothetical protein
MLKTVDTIATFELIRSIWVSKLEEIEPDLELLSKGSPYDSNTAIYVVDVTKRTSIVVTIFTDSITINRRVFDFSDPDCVSKAETHMKICSARRGVKSQTMK